MLDRHPFRRRFDCQRQRRHRGARLQREGIDRFVRQHRELAARHVDRGQSRAGNGVELLAENPGLRPQDVFVNLEEVVKENWSFGNGIAQYV